MQPTACIRGAGQYRRRAHPQHRWNSFASLCGRARARAVAPRPAGAPLWPEARRAPCSWHCVPQAGRTGPLPGPVPPGWDGHSPVDIRRGCGSVWSSTHRNRRVPAPSVGPLPLQMASVHELECTPRAYRALHGVDKCMVVTSLPSQCSCPFAWCGVAWSQ